MNYLEITLPEIFEVVEITINNELYAETSRLYDCDMTSIDSFQIKVPLPKVKGRWEVKSHSKNKLILMEV